MAHEPSYWYQTRNLGGELGSCAMGLSECPHNSYISGIYSRTYIFLIVGDSLVVFIRLRIVANESEGNSSQTGA